MIVRPLALVTLLAALVCLSICRNTLADLNDPLPVDARNVTGTFDNGVRYLIRSNATPPGRVCAYLHVQTGALNETEAQNGLAHFIEHMAFNGSQHFKPGSLIPLLQHLGMRFGADTNAHTGLNETVFKLKLPDNEPQHLDLAMKIFADYAYGLTLAPIEIDSERRIILEEARSRKSASERISKLSRRSVYADSRLAVHDVIGDEELIKTLPKDQFDDYWNTWYRPENMTVIIVGDVKPDAVLPVVKKWLGEFTARAPSRQTGLAELKVTREARAFVFSDPEQTATEVEMTRLAAAEPKIATVADYRARLLDALTSAMVNRRIADRVTAGDAPFQSGNVEVQDLLHEAKVIGAEASGDQSDWNKALDGLITEVNRALEHGFTAGEFDLAKRGALESADQAVSAEQSRDSFSWIDSISTAIGRETPLLSAEQEREILRATLATITIEQLDQAFKDEFESSNFDYVVTVPPAKDGVTLPTEAQVMSAATAAWAKRTNPPTTAPSDSPLLAVEPDAGSIVTQVTDPDLKLTTVNFANGVVMHHLFNDYRKGQVAVRIMLPGGQIEEDADTRGLTEVASLALAQPCTDRLSSTQIRDSLVGKSIQFGGGVSFDEFVLNVAGNAKDLKTGMQLAHAVLTSGRIEASAVVNWKHAAIQSIGQRQVQVGGQLQQALSDTLYGGDSRFQPLTLAGVDHLTIDKAQAWFNRIAHEAPIEVAVVGDCSLGDATDLVARYLGSLPKATKTFASLDPLRTLARKSGPFGATVSFGSVTPQALSLAGFVTCDERSPDRRPLALAASILTDRMIAQVRERDQLVYSIAARNEPSRGLPGTGLFAASSTTDPANATRLVDSLIHIMQDFADNGPTESELVTAKLKTAKELDIAMREPGWWMAQVSELEYRGRPLADLKSLPAVFDTFTTDDVRNTFAKYMKADALVSLPWSLCRRHPSRPLNRRPNLIADVLVMKAEPADAGSNLGQ